MRSVEGHVPEAGAVPVAPDDEPGHLPSRPVGVVIVLGQVPAAVRERVLDTVRRLLARVASLSQKVLIVVLHHLVAPIAQAARLVDQQVVEADAVARRVDVELAHTVGLVARVAEGLGNGRQVGHGHHRVEDPVAVGLREGAGHQLSSCRNTCRRGCVGIGESDAVRDHLVDGRRQDGRMSQGADHLAGPVVGADQEHVRSGHQLSSSVRAVLCGPPVRPGGVAGRLEP